MSTSVVDGKNSRHGHESPTAAGVERVLDAFRQGEIVRVLRNDAGGVPSSGGHLLLAAEKASSSSIAELLQLSGSDPVFVATRDRLERLQIVGSRNGCPTGSDAPATIDDDALQRYCGAAHVLACSNPQPAGTALRGLCVECTDWGGLVACQRPGEAAIDLCRLAGLPPAALVCQIRTPLPEPVERLCPTVTFRELIDLRRALPTSRLVKEGPRTRLPTHYGQFWLQSYEDPLTGQLHLALWTGELRDPVLVRVHSECMTGDMFGSLRCDCGPQLARSLTRLAQEQAGVLIYLRQEGRGIGLSNKLRTYAIQDLGFDTVEANEQIGFEADLRDYSLAAEILVDLGVSTIRLLTNNPQKVRGLKKNGIQILERVPLEVEPSLENRSYLAAKRSKLNHWLS